jgi:adenylate kinase
MVIEKKFLFPFIAPPNGGKGTQTNILATRYGLPVFDMGSTFRSILKEDRDPEMKAELESYMQQGQLVPIEIVVKVFKKNFQALMLANPDAPGFILDGFPRNLEQASAFEVFCLEEESLLSFTRAIYLNVSLDIVKRRATGRRFCSQNARHVYNIFIEGLKPASKTDTQGEITWYCHEDKAPLVLRPDDSEEVVEKRLLEYQAETEPLIEYYRSNNSLYEVDGNLSPVTVTESILKCLQPFIDKQCASNVTKGN